MSDTETTLVTSTGLLKLTQVEIDYLQSFITANDRGGYYLALYNMTGVTQVLVQGEISTFSGAAGGAAYVANMRMYDTNPVYKQNLAAYIQGLRGDTRYLGRPVTLDTFSNIIAQTDLNVIKQYVSGIDDNGNILSESTGYLNDRAMLDKAVLAWENVRIPELFPGNVLDGLYTVADEPQLISPALKRLVQTILARVGRNNQRALRHVHMTYKHNSLVGSFGVPCVVYEFYFGCRNALGLIATYASYSLHRL
jgi:hypothetical protein